MKCSFLKTGLILLAFNLTFSSLANADEGDPTPEQCLRSFSKNYVPEGNNKNDYIISDDKNTMREVVDVVRSYERAWVVELADNSLRYADAVGVVFQYQDEVHMIFASVKIDGGKCQVKELADVNTADIEASPDETLLAKYFLQIRKSKLPKIAREWIYDDVKNKLKGEE